MGVSNHGANAITWNRAVKKRALICGVSGQDGAYLARLLIDKGYEVVGTSRDAQSSSFVNLHRIGIIEQVKTCSMTLTDFRSVYQALSLYNPDEIYNLAGQTSVGLSFQQPMETFESITVGVLNLLETIRFIDKPIRLYNAGSGECFGDTGDFSATLDTPFRPRSPYATAKAAAYWAISNYREAYNIFACTGVLYNHESPLRAPYFVTKKIVSAACNIARGRQDRLELGNIDIRRDWGWAPEYVEAMWLMLQQDSPDDYVIATGESRSLEEFCQIAFAYFGLNYKDYVIRNDELLRPTDIFSGRGNTEKARTALGWIAHERLDGIIMKMIEEEINIDAVGF